MKPALFASSISSSGQDAQYAGFYANLWKSDCLLQAVHAWPDNWQVSGADFMTNWVNCHIAASASLGKPMVLEEVRAACLCCVQAHDMPMLATLKAMHSYITLNSLRLT